MPSRCAKAQYLSRFARTDRLSTACARCTGESHMEPLTSSIYRPEHEAFRETLRRFLEHELTPNIEAWERDGIIARSFWRRAGQIGLISPGMPEEYGGPRGHFRPPLILPQETRRCRAGGSAGAALRSV